ncbi:MAG: hypothetical protein SOX22_05740 [Bacteroidaceae bacterium]|nr:hypothetical protein [Paraprevotella sp.]MDD6821193.1 hypothetical protein [Paraprevotella sp.]MDY3288472.1 hypothetical protein [Bacteroidaceae bacterium]
MLRKVLTMLLIAVSSMQASAQFEKYTSYLNTSLTGLGLSYSKDSRFKMGVQATGGYFVEDCWMLYGRFGFEHQGARGVMKNRNDLQIGVGGRYYIEQNGIFLGVGLAYQHATNVTFSQHESIIGRTTENGPVEIRTVYNYYGNRNYVHLTPEVGYCFYVNNYLSIEPSVYCNLCLNRFSEGTEIGLKLGMGFYF